jgi:hypothetical protein
MHRYDIIEKKLIEKISRDIEEINETDRDTYICLDCFLEANFKTIHVIIYLIMDETDEEEDENDNEELYDSFIIQNLSYNPEDGEFVQYDCKCNN